MWNEITYSVDTNQVIISAPGPQGPPGSPTSSVSYSTNSGSSSYAASAGYAPAPASVSYASSAGYAPAPASVSYAASAGLVTSASGIPTRWYGSFYSASTQAITNTSSAYAMVLGNTDYNNGVINNGSSVTFSNTGIYNIQWSGQFSNTSNNDQDIYVWLKKNGQDYLGSTGLISVPSSHAGTDGHIIAGWNYILSINSGDFIQFYWGAQSTAVSLRYYASATNPTRPDTVSLIVTAVQV
jgi:hypothetical protein